MRYMMVVKGDENFAASGPPPAELMEAVEKAGKTELHRKHWPAWEGETEIRLMYEDNEHP